MGPTKQKRKHHQENRKGKLRRRHVLMGAIRKIKPEIVWRISLASKAKIEGFENPEEFIKQLFNNLVSQDSLHVKFKNEHRPAKYEYAVEKWQHDKMDDIARKTFDGLTVSSDGQFVSYNINYEIGFPSDWTKRDVQEWVVEEGPGEISKAHIFIFTEDIVDGRRKRDESYKNEREFVDRLTIGLKIIDISKK